MSVNTLLFLDISSGPDHLNVAVIAAHDQVVELEGELWPGWTNPADNFCGNVKGTQYYNLCHDEFSLAVYRRLFSLGVFL